MTIDALFARDRSRFVPTERALGPWGRGGGVLHGGAVAALLAHCMEVELEADGKLPARLSVDLYRPVPFAPLDVEVSVVRDGRRVRVVEASIAAAGVSMSRGVGLFVLPGSEPPLDLPQTASAMELPERFSPVRVPREPVSHATSLEIRGTMRHTEPVAGAGLWIRPVYPVVVGGRLTPFTRAATVSDWTNPVANYGPEGISYINADITLYLYREPVGAWIGLTPAARHSAAGVALSDCTVHDRIGPAGRCITACLATSEMASGKSPAGQAA